MIDELKRIHMFRYTAPHTKHASKQYDEPNSVRTAAMLLHLFKGIEHFQPDKYKRNAITCFNTTLCVLRIDIILLRHYDDKPAARGTGACMLPISPFLFSRFSVSLHIDDKRRQRDMEVV